MSNLSNIGFVSSDDESLSALIEQAFERATTPPELGDWGTRHTFFRDPSGAAIAFHVDRKEITCLTPFFVPPGGGTRWTVATTTPHLDNDCKDCSGADCDVFEGPSREMVTRSTVQWLYFAPYSDWLRHERTFQIDVVGFASTLHLCADDDEWETAQASVFGGTRKPGEKIEPGKPTRLAGEAFMPYGMFDNAGDVSPRARAFVTGSVESVSHPTNALTGERFTWVRLRSMLGHLDVVSTFEGDIQCSPGMRAFADVWIVGRPVEPPPKRGFWLKLLGR